jgi:hypothetical protein
MISGTLLVMAVQAVPASVDSLAFPVELTDPVRPDSGAGTHKVVLSLDKNGFPETYQLSLYIDVCLEKICKPLYVSLFWDALGDYKNFDHPEQHPFTKYDHAEFTPVDYETLDAILKDRNSLLGKHPLSFFVEQFTRDPAKVDAVTSATPQAIQDAVVKDAAYTSWTLWHWANGEIVGRLYENTLDLINDDYLIYCLMSEDPRFVRFGLERISQRERIDKPFRESCFHILENSGYANCKLALKVLTTNPADTLRLQRRLVDMIGLNAGSSQLIIGYFEDLAAVDPVIWADMGARIKYIVYYYDVFTLLLLLEERAGNSEEVRIHVQELSKSKDPNIARRAREFLDK